MALSTWFPAELWTHTGLGARGERWLSWPGPSQGRVCLGCSLRCRECGGLPPGSHALTSVEAGASHKVLPVEGAARGVQLWGQRP